MVAPARSSMPVSTARSAVVCASGPDDSRVSATFAVGPESFVQSLSLGHRTSFQPFVSAVVSGTGRIASLALAGPMVPGKNRLGIALAEVPPALLVSLPADSTTCLRSLELSYVATKP